MILLLTLFSESLSICVGRWVPVNAGWCLMASVH